MGAVCIHGERETASEKDNEQAVDREGVVGGTREGREEVVVEGNKQSGNITMQKADEEEDVGGSKEGCNKNTQNCHIDWVVGGASKDCDFAPVQWFADILPAFAKSLSQQGLAPKKALSPSAEDLSPEEGLTARLSESHADSLPGTILLQRCGCCMRVLKDWCCEPRCCLCFMGLQFASDAGNPCFRFMDPCIDWLLFLLSFPLFFIDVALYKLAMCFIPGWSSSWYFWRPSLMRACCQRSSALCRITLLLCDLLCTISLQIRWNRLLLWWSRFGLGDDEEQKMLIEGTPLIVLQDRLFVLAAVTLLGPVVLSYVDRSFKADREVMVAALSHNP